MRGLGIDPGFTGALALVDRVGGKLKFVEGFDVPVVGEASRKRVAIVEVARWLEEHLPIDFVVVEAARLRAPVNATSGGAYMLCAGYLEAMVRLAGFEPYMVEPQSWKAKMGLKLERIKDESYGARKKRAKSLSRSVALRLLPGASTVIDRPGDHNRAEAMLLAIRGFDLHPMV